MFSGGSTQPCAAALSSTMRGLSALRAKLHTLAVPSVGPSPTPIVKDFSVPGGELTGSQKLKKNVVHDKFKAEIESMYA